MEKLVAAFCPTCLSETSKRLQGAGIPYTVMAAGYSPARPCFACAAATHHVLITA